MLIVHPESGAASAAARRTSHLDFVPTIVAMTGKSHDARGRHHGAHEGQGPHARCSGSRSIRTSAGARGGVLFCYSQLMVHDPGFTKFFYETLRNKSIARTDQLKTIEAFPIDWSLRVAIRSITDERYRFTRYFSFRGFNTPTTLDELRAKNDLELYDLRADPDEVVNLAYDFDANRDLIAAMNAKLNALIAAEIGVDDGSFLPLKDWIDWGKAGPASVNL